MIRRDLFPSSFLLAIWLVTACGAHGSGARRADLDPAKVTAIQVATADGKPTFCANGPPVQLKATVQMQGGGALETGDAEGNLGFDRFEWYPSAGEVDKQGKLRAPADPFALVDRTVQVTVRVTGRTDVEGKLELSPSFACGGVADARGQAGQAGAAGGPGVAGRIGREGNAVAAASNGELGTPGEPGGAGTDGRPGPSVDVALAWVKTQKHGRLVLVRAGSASFLVDPAGGKLTFAVDGGAGGAGGPGGKGGDGGDGGGSSAQAGQEGVGGDGSDGGAGGRGGKGGDGGTVRVQYDSRHPELMDAIQISSRGGAGGSGGEGGRAGDGGKGGASPTGQRGPSGRSGRSGNRGVAGQAGKDGPPVDAQPGDVSTLFADEIRRGVPVEVAAP